MSWATGRRVRILAVVSIVLLVIMGGIGYLIFHKAPSCTDGIQNQNEEGIDCGGYCTYLCSASVVQPVVSFVRELSQTSGRTDVIAYIKNPNPTSAVKDAHYTIELYDARQSVIATKDGVVDLAPGIDAVVFIPNFFQGTESVNRAFLSFDDASLKWFRYEESPTLPQVSDARVVGTQEAPRISAIVRNPFSTTLRGIKLIATVFNSEGNAIAASQTVVSELPAQGSTDIVFTWSAPFSDPVSRIDVHPVSTVPNP